MSVARALLLDLDGTLLDTAPDFVSVLNGQLVRHHRSPLPESDIRATVSDGARALITLGFGIAPEHADFAGLLQELLDGYRAVLGRDTVLFKGMEDCLLKLEQQDIPWGVITNKPIRYAEPLMRRLDLHARCALLICPDHVTNTKPDAEPLLLAAQWLDLPPGDCLYAGDHRRDIEAAKAAGMDSAACRWGYWHEADAPEQWQARHTLDFPLELLPRFGL